MNPGDIVTLRSGIVSVNLMSDPFESAVEELSKNNLETALTVFDIRSFRRGETGIVVEINKNNSARVKILYQSRFWWANVSDMLVLR